MDQPASASRPERVVYWTMCLLPWAWLALFGLFVLRARLALGNWPTPYHPDPKDLGFDIHYGCLVFGLSVAVAAPVGAGILLLASRVLRRTRDARYGPGAIVLAAGWIAMFVLARLDAGRLFTWFMD